MPKHKPLVTLRELIMFAILCALAIAYFGWRNYEPRIKTCQVVGSYYVVKDNCIAELG